jgi:hypothetical protein
VPAVGAHVTHVVEVETQREDLAAPAGIVDDLAARPRDQRLADAERAGDVHVEEVALVHRRARPHHAALRIAVDAADVGHVEDDEVRTRREALFIGQPGELLAIARDDLAVGVDDGRGVESVVAAALEDRAGYQPHVVAFRDFAKTVLERAGHLLREPAVAAIGVQFAEHQHVHPGVALHDRVDRLFHRVDVVAVDGLELQSCYADFAHGCLPYRWPH